MKVSLYFKQSPSRDRAGLESLTPGILVGAQRKSAFGGDPLLQLIWKRTKKLRLVKSGVTLWAFNLDNE